MEVEVSDIPTKKYIYKRRIKIWSNILCLFASDQMILEVKVLNPRLRPHTQWRACASHSISAEMQRRKSGVLSRRTAQVKVRWVGAWGALAGGPIVLLLFLFLIPLLFSKSIKEYYSPPFSSFLKRPHKKVFYFFKI